MACLACLAAAIQVALDCGPTVATGRTYMSREMPPHAAATRAKKRRRPAKGDGVCREFFDQKRHTRYTVFVVHFLLITSKMPS